MRTCFGVVVRREEAGKWSETLGASIGLLDRHAERLAYRDELQRPLLLRSPPIVRRSSTLAAPERE